MSLESKATNEVCALEAFLPYVSQWFRENLGDPTPTQAQSWPHIRAKENTLILAPTGSGKTLAAFLVCLDELWRGKKNDGTTSVLYLSPLKALNNDIQRNLKRPLDGILSTAQARGESLIPLSAAVRTGDTTPQERQAQIRKPPDILITTPESLHLLLTSRGRATLGGVTHVIVDEIHAMVPNKRGVFLSLLLERLEEIRSQAGNRTPMVRIGLSATQRPLSEVARFLGGYVATSDGRFAQRPVTLIDGGIRKELDLEVVSPLEGLGLQGDHGVWPGIYRLLRREIEAHQSTIVFANDRRAVERITSWVNGESPLAKSHHGSVSLEKRRQTEEDLKKGVLKAVVATASLEMGIDMGSVDLVMQVESPGSVSRALQRVGRAGHIVGMKSKGRMIPKTHPDLVEMAVLAREMKLGRVEEVRMPTCSLDILCQQIVAMVAMEDWEVERLFGVIRRAAPYRDLSAEAFEQALELVSGRYRFGRKKAEGEEEVIPARASTLEALQPRISWDRVQQRLRALPGSHHISLVNGGAIPDTGNFAVIGPDGSRIGELDEEFIYERRVGESFLLGTTAWRIEKIEVDRVLVRRSEGELAQLPFWRGEGPGRTFGLGKAMGLFLSELEQRLESTDRLDWLCEEYLLDRAAARGLCGYLTRQLLSAGVVPTDRTILIEASRDSLGDWQVLVLSPLGARFHLGLRLALESVLKELLGYRPQIHHHDDGLVIRMTDTDSPVLDLLERLDPAELEDRILGELGDSPLFAIRFRQNASRALLLPKAQPGKRSPLWLQRLRGRDLLQVARKHPDFPIIAETFRECLMDHLELDALRGFLELFRRGGVKVVKRQAEAPCPFAQDVLFSFTAANLYQTDIVEPETQTGQKLDRGLLDQIFSPATAGDGDIEEASVRQADLRIRGLTLLPRTRSEMAEILRRLGDLNEGELLGGMADFVRELVAT
jgi:ATP-dependent Lhr-like helicase